jgi:hypothetical protein
MTGISEGKVIRLNDFTVNFVGPSTVVFKTIGRGSDVTFGDAECLSIVECFDGGKGVDVAVEEFSEFLEELTTGLRGQFTPWTIVVVICLAGSIDCNIDILLGSFLY